MRRFLQAIGVVLLAAAALVVASVVHFMIYGPPKPTWSDDAIVEIRIEESTPPAKAGAARSTVVVDPQRVRAILAALKPQGPVPAHKCADRAAMLLTKQDGETVRMRLLPGHDCDYYEVGVEGWRAERVERKAFLAALKAAGVDWLPEECGQ